MSIYTVEFCKDVKKRECVNNKTINRWEELSYYRYTQRYFDYSDYCHFRCFTNKIDQEQKSSEIQEGGDFFG